MNTSYSIPETAKLTGIPEHAIREYAKQFADVLPTPEANGESGRLAVKRYPDSALAIFRSIRKLKDDGFDAHQIRTALLAEQSYTGLESAKAAVESWEELPVEAAVSEESVVEELEATVEASAIEEAVELALEAAGDESVELIAEPIAALVEEVETGEPVEAAPTVEAEEPVEVAAAEAPETTETLAEHAFTLEAAGEVPTEAEAPVTATFHPVFTNLDDGLRQLRKIMDHSVCERETLRSERDALLVDQAAKSDEIASLKAAVAEQQDKIGSLQAALNALMSQCDQQLQAIRSALGQS